MPRCRYCLIPSDEVSTTAYLHPARTMSRNNFCNANLPSIVILVGFNHSFSPTLKFTVEVNPTQCLKAELWFGKSSAFALHASSKILAIKFTVVDFPFVPVTPITTIFSDGRQYHAAAIFASAK